MIRKLWTLVITTSFVMTNFMPAFAEDAPVSSGEVVAVIRNDDGSTTVVSQAAEIQEDGTADVVLEAGIDPAVTPVELIATTPAGTITAQAPTKGDEVVADSETTLANNLINSMIAQFEDEVGYDLDPKQREIMLEEGKKFFEKLPTDGVENVEDLMSLAADYSSLHPEGPMELIQEAGLPIPGEEALIAATLANKAFRPDEGSYDPMGIPHRMLEEGEEYPSNMALGLLPENMLPPFLRGDKGREEMLGFFGDHVGLPGDYECDIPEGAIAFDEPFTFKAGREMPPGFLPPPLFAFPDDPDMYPEDMSNFQIPGSAILPEEALLAMKERIGEHDGFLPQLPPLDQMPFAADFAEFGFPVDKDYDPAEMAALYEPPPGAAEGDDGSVFVPKGFDPREFFAEFDADKIHTMPTEFDHLFHHGPDEGPIDDIFGEPPAGFDFGHMEGIPRDFDFEAFGHEPPAGFDKMEFVHHDDFKDRFGEDFQPDIDDFFGGFDPRAEGPYIPDGQLFDHLAGNEEFSGLNPDEIKAHFEGLSESEQDAFKDGFLGDAFEHEPPADAPGEPPADDLFGDKPDGDQFFDPGTGEPVDGGQAFDPSLEPVVGDEPDQNFEDLAKDGHPGELDPSLDPEGIFVDQGKDDSAAQPEPVVVEQEPVLTADKPGEQVATGEPPPPPPPPSGGDAGQGGGGAPPAGGDHHHARVNSNRAYLLTTSTETIEDKTGVKSVLVASTKAKAKKITASKGVYQIGKAKASKKKAVVSFIVDPSIADESVNVNLSLSDGDVDNVEVTLDDSATEEVVTQLDGKTIDMSITESLSLNKAKGYLLAPGSSTLKIQKAISIKGSVADGASGGSVITWKLPKKKLSAGVYTVVFENDGTSYYGKVTIGSLEAKTLKVKVSAPKG